MHNAKHDAVDRIIEQWTAQGIPAKQLNAMETIGRIKRIQILLEFALVENFQQFDLSSWEFDVLATLRRNGEPYCLSPTELFATMMVSSGTMTNRLQHLEKKAFVTREANPKDGRSLLVKLTDKGLQAIDACVAQHIELENRLLANMKREEVVQLNQLLKALEAQLPQK